MTELHFLWLLPWSPPPPGLVTLVLRKNWVFEQPVATRPRAFKVRTWLLLPSKVSIFRREMQVGPRNRSFCFVVCLRCQPFCSTRCGFTPHSKSISETHRGVGLAGWRSFIRYCPHWSPRDVGLAALQSGPVCVMKSLGWLSARYHKEENVLTLAGLQYGKRAL